MTMPPTRSATVPQRKSAAIALLLVAEVAAMSLWFVSAAILPDMLREAPLSPFRQAALSSGVQAGFVVGALASAILGLADRFDPRRVFALCAVGAGFANAVLLVAPPGGGAAIVARIMTGALLAGVYPVGMKIAVGWGQRDRGFLVGALVGALTLGSAAPHLIALAGGADWRVTVAAASLAAAIAGVLCLAASLGPHHGRAARFDPRVIAAAWTNRRVRLAYAGYLGHMWELYAMWAWIAAASAASYAATLSAAEAERLAKITAFVAIGGPAWLTFAIVTVWGIAIVPDSAQFSALVADAALPEQAGSLMTFQTALGFALTFATVQATPVIAAAIGWPPVLAGLALGPAFGIVAMLRLRALTRAG